MGDVTPIEKLTNYTEQFIANWKMSKILDKYIAKLGVVIGLK